MVSYVVMEVKSASEMVTCYKIGWKKYEGNSRNRPRDIKFKNEMTPVEQLRVFKCSWFLHLVIAYIDYHYFGCTAQWSSSQVHFSWISLT